MNRLRPLWILLGLGALTIGGFRLARLTLEEIELASVVRRTEALKAEFYARDSSRPVLRGTARPGNAWDHYILAMREMKADDKLDLATVKLLWDFTGDRPTTNPSIVDEILANYDSVLGHIRTGVQCGEARFPYHWSLEHIRPGVQFGDPDFSIDWEKEWGSWNPHSMRGISLVSVAKSKRLRANGHEMEAAELMLDMCLYARDQAQDDLWPVSGLASSALDELHDILVSGRLSMAELNRVDRELGVLIEASANPARALMNNVLGRGMDIRKEARYGRQMIFWQHTAGGRDFYSYRLMNSRAFRLLDRWTRRLVSAERLPWPKAREIEQRIREKARSAGEEMEMVSGISVSLGGAGNRRQEAAKLRILRVAAHYLATGEVLQIEDPLGSGPLKVEVGSKLKIWSVGRDGLDDSGRGSWKGYYNQDLVLELSPGDR